MDFVEGKEPVAVATIVDERRLKRRFDPCYLGQVDIARQLAAGLGFKVEFLDFVSVHDHDPGFFRVGRIDKHFLWHVVRSHDNANGARGALLSGWRDY